MERFYCHGGISPEKKALDDGCVVLWPVWPYLGYLDETARLIEAGMPPPPHLTRNDWRLIVRLKNKRDEIRYESMKGGDD